MSSIIDLLKLMYPNHNLRVSEGITKHGETLQEIFGHLQWNDLAENANNPDPKPTWQEFSTNHIIAPLIQNEDVFFAKGNIDYIIKRKFESVMNMATVTYSGVDYQSNIESIYILSSSLSNGELTKSWSDVNNNLHDLTNYQRTSLLGLMLEAQEINFKRKMQLRNALKEATTINELESIKSDVNNCWADNPYIGN